MPAHPKLTARRRNRLIALMRGGASLAEASRAVSVTPRATYLLAERDAKFAQRLRSARRAASPDEITWQQAAAMIEADFPADWSPLALPDIAIPEWDH